MPRRASPFAAFPVAALACALNFGCAGETPPAPAEFTPLAATPRREVIALTIAAPESSHLNPRVPPALRPGRYVVESDGALRAALGTGASDDTFPPVVRALSPAQHARLAAAAQAALEPGPEPAPPQSSATATPSASPAYTLELRARGGSRRVTLPLSDPRARRLAAAFADLAWVR
jgi:hypothetical protein